MNLKNYSQHFLKCALLSFGMILSSAVLNAQKLTLELKNVTIKEFLNKVTEQTNLKFVYSNVLTELNERVSISYTDKDWEDILKEVLTSKGVMYKKQGNQILLSSNQIINKGKEIIVKGKITDSGTGDPIPGAVISVKGEKEYSLSDNDGNYSIKTNDNALLSFFSLGMTTSEIPVNKRVVINVELKTDIIKLDDVVVTGYQTLDKGRATGSFEVVGQEKLKTVVTNNFISKLEGVVPGLQIDANGDMLIRGKASIYAASKPLIVVDGFPMEYDTYNINPNDIEQISVLKDAASASIWGVRAANGVIVITTKQGKKGQKATVTYNGLIRVATKKDLESMEKMTSAQMIDVNREYYDKGFASISLTSKFPVYDDWGESYYKWKKGIFTEAQYNEEVSKLASYDNLSDIKKYFYQTPLLQQHNISIQNGTANSSNYVSMYFEGNKADLIKNDYKKVGLQFNNTTDIFKWLSLGTGIRANYTDMSSFSDDFRMNYAPYIRLFNEDGSYYNQNRTKTKHSYYQGLGVGDWSYNKLQDRDQIDNDTKKYNLSANVKLDFKLPFNIKFSTSGMYTLENQLNEKFYTKESFLVRDNYNKFSKPGAKENEWIRQFPDGGILYNTHINSSSYTWRNILSYSESFKNLSISAQAGFEVFAIRTLLEESTSYGYDRQTLSFNNAFNVGEFTSSVPGYDGSNQRLYSHKQSHADAEDRYVSAFGTATATYFGKYSIFGSVRYDKTNLYGRSKKYRDQPTWSVGAKWDISKEKFFSSTKINLFSVKASYGLSGNIDKSTSPYLIAANEKDYAFQLDALKIQNPANPMLRWEKVYTLNAGIDLSLFNSRLNLSLEYYNKKTEDALGQSIMDPTSGWNTSMLNSASITNNGIDISVNATPVLTKKFSWNTNLTFSYNTNKVTKLNSGEANLTKVTTFNPIVGKPLDYIYALRGASLDKTGEPQIYNGKGELLSYLKTNTLSVDDILFMGRRNPPIFGAWSNNISYGGFTLDFIITYNFGNKVYLPGINYFYEETLMANLDKRWREPGDEEKTWVPKLSESTGTRNNSVSFSDKRVASGSVVRLKSLGLSYNFKNIIKTKTIEALNLKVTAENLVKIVGNGYGYDPEMLVRSTFAPMYMGNLPKIFTISLNITL